MDFAEWPVWAGATLIFLARVCDVTLGTLRISFISRGEKNLAPLVAFIEMIIWLFAISQVVQNFTNVAYFLAYSGGFASGVFVGLQIEERLALGRRIVRTITESDATDLIAAVRSAGFGATSVRGAGGSGDVSVIFSVVDRADVQEYLEVVEAQQPGAFVSVEDVTAVRQGVFPARRPLFVFPAWRK